LLDWLEKLRSRGGDTKIKRRRDIGDPRLARLHLPDVPAYFF
jgi:hypothetical protein